MREIQGCPWQHVERWALDALNLWAHFKRGHLWRPGGVAAQPAIYMELMALVDDEVGKVKAEKDRRAREAVERQNRGRRG